MNMRPGVYVEHTITKVPDPYKTKNIGIIALGGTSNELKKITNLTQASLIFPNDCNAFNMIKTVLNQISCDIYIIGQAVQDVTSYMGAVDILLKEQSLYCIVSDFDNAELTQYVAEKISDNAKLYLSGCSMQTDPILYAKAINNARICLCFPKIVLPDSNFDISPLLLAILVLKGENLNRNLSGNMIENEYIIDADIEENDKNSYIYNGINIFEPFGQYISLIRGVTTHTINSEGNYDSTYRNICTIIAIDTVKTTIIELLTTRLSGNNPASSLGAILSLVICALVDLKDMGTISQYEKPVVTLDPIDSSICRISVNVTINQGINQIYLQLNMNI